MPLAHLINELRRDLPPIPASTDGHRDTATLLDQLLHEDHWQPTQIDTIGQLSRRMEISGRLHSHYDQHWRPDGPPLAEPWCSVAALQLYRATRLDQSNQAPLGIQLKRFNALLKSLSNTGQEWASPDSDLQQQALTDFQQLLTSRHTDRPTVNPVPPPTSTNPPDKAKILPLTVLFYEGPIARAYLETIHAAGFRPRKIIQLVSSLDISTRKPVGRLLPALLREPYAAAIQQSRIHHWPRKIASAHPELRSAIAAQVQQQLGFSHQTQDAASALKPLQYYCDDIEPLLVTGLKDPQLHQQLAQRTPDTLLFTGGGIVPASLLGIDGLRFIHIHPGYLPDIRGADCVLWSTLLTGQCSASSFYLSPGIDTGDIIERSWLPTLDIHVDVGRYDLKTLYRAVYGFLDPWIRAFVLRSTITKQREFSTIATQTQQEHEGINYHFMHPDMQRAALRALLTAVD